MDSAFRVALSYFAEKPFIAGLLNLALLPFCHLPVMATPVDRYEVVSALLAGILAVG